MLPPARTSAPRLALPRDRDPTGQGWRPCCPRPHHTNQLFSGKSWERHPQGLGGTNRPPLPLSPILPPAGPELRCPGMEKNLCRERSPREPSLGTAARETPPGSPAEPRWRRVAPGMGTDGQGTVTNSDLSRFPVPILPTRAALPRPATPEATLERDPVGRGPRSPPAPGRTQRRDGGAGQRERRTRDSGARDTAIRCGSGARAPRSPELTHHWNMLGVGRGGRSAAGRAARGPGASLCALPPPLLFSFSFFFPPYFFSFPSPLSPRWSLEMDGRAGRLTLALPFWPVPSPPAPADGQLSSVPRARSLRVTPHTSP